MTALIPLLVGSLFAASATFGLSPPQAQSDHKPSAESPQLLAQAEMLLQSGKVEEALPLLQEYLKARPDSPDGRTALGFVLFKQSKAAESLREYAEAARHRTLTAFELKIVGLDYAMLEDFPNADRGLTRSLAMSPGDLQACNSLGEIKFLQEKYEEAIGVFERCLKLDTKNVFASNGLGGAYERIFQNDKAVAAYRNAVAWQSGKPLQDPTPFLNLGRLLLRLDKTGEALEYLTRAVELGPEHALAHEQLSKGHSFAGDLEAAQKELEKAIQINPEDAHLHYVLAQLYRRREMPDKADRELEQYQLLKKPPGHPPNQPQ